MYGHVSVEHAVHVPEAEQYPFSDPDVRQGVFAGAMGHGDWKTQKDPEAMHESAKTVQLKKKKNTTRGLLQ